MPFTVIGTERITRTDIETVKIPVLTVSFMILERNENCARNVNQICMVGHILRQFHSPSHVGDRRVTSPGD